MERRRIMKKIRSIQFKVFICLFISFMVVFGYIVKTKYDQSFNELLYHEMTHYITTELRKYQQQMTARSFEIKNELEVNTGNTSVVKELENQQRYIDSINGEIDILL